MGIITNAKQYISRSVSNTAKSIGDGISAVAILNPEQLNRVDARRKAYLEASPDLCGDDARNLIQKNLGAIGVEVNQAYLEVLRKVYCPVNISFDSFDEDNRIRYFDITKWVVDSEEQSLDKLVNVYHVLCEENCNIALIYHRTKNQCKVTIGLANTNEESDEPSIADNYYERLAGAIRGNFPGSEFKEINFLDDYGLGTPESLNEIFDEKDKVKSIAMVSNVASEKSEAFISQSMEKLLDGIVPRNEKEDYTIVLLAKPVIEQLQSKNRIFELYAALKPYETWQINTGTSENATEGSSFNLGGNLGLNISHSIGSSAGFAAPTPYGIASVGNNQSNSVGANFGISFQRASNVSVTLGKNENVIQTFVNFNVKHTLDLLETQLKRIEESSALGMWDFAAYVISDSPIIANNVASMYLALTQGEESFLTRAAIHFWDGDIEPEATRAILESIKRLQHPVLGLRSSVEDDWLMYPELVTPSVSLSGKELARALNFPRKSVNGLPVLEAVSFGREPQSIGESILDLDIGCSYHMRKVNGQHRIFLSKEELTKHVFITGSTGSGKSNTIYKILEKLNKKFLVIEPAKGEYKDVIGKIEGVTTYGTNPIIRDIPLLRLNPFKFPKGIHILEHLDRLVEIFNVCWPMYAAMPAILKDSVERAYIRCGWDLERSINKYGEELFPTFADVVREIRQVLSESDYSDDNKGDYTGSLVTRLRSLTNGINGLIFSVNDLEDEKLFDEKVIVDLSRVGSTETKALIMGVLILKLQEHRSNQRNNVGHTNENLQHITILEEAHTLLKRTNTEQSGEGANLLGKAVEMLANSIAEMRSYGEGFIIADQSPGLLDMSVIRNTNTKIILRLPDYGDRQLVGRAAGLNDSQINELARLEKGVAAVSQSDWLEPVLCKVDKYSVKETESPKLILENDSDVMSAGEEMTEKSLLELVLGQELYRKDDRIDIQKAKNAVLKSALDSTIKCDYLEYISSEPENEISSLRKLIYDLLNADQIIYKARRFDKIEEWTYIVKNCIEAKGIILSRQQLDQMLAVILYEQSLRDPTYNDLFRAYTELHKEIERGGLL